MSKDTILLEALEKIESRALEVLLNCFNDKADFIDARWLLPIAASAIEAYKEEQ